MHEGTLREDGSHCDSGECWCWNDRYQVVTRESTKELMEAVNAFIHQKGWKPLGGVCVSVSNWEQENSRKGYTETRSETVWAQAMVRHV